MHMRQFKVGGLHCGGCASSVQQILQTQKGVLGATVDLTSARATVDASADFDAAAAAKAVAQAGFSLDPV